MKPLAEQVLEWCGLAGLAGLADFIPWAKLGLGVALTFLAAFLLNGQRAETSNAEETRARRTGPGTIVLRVGLLLTGMTLLVGAVGDGHRKYEANPRTGLPLSREAKGLSVEKEQNLPLQRGSLGQSNRMTDRTRVRAENNSSPASNSPTAATKWKFLHK